MLYLSELREDNIVKLREIFGENANIFAGNFLELKGNMQQRIQKCQEWVANLK